MDDIRIGGSRRLARWRSTILFCSLLTLVGLCGAQSVLRIARIENVPDQQVGAEILTVVYSKLGIQLQFVDGPAKRSLLESSEGRLDGEIQRVLDVQNEYPTLLAVPVSINYIEPTAFTKRASFAVTGWDSLRPYKIGIVRGVGSSERGTAGMPQVEPTTNMEQMMLMLNADRTDVAVNDLFSGMLILHRLGLQEVIHPLLPVLQRIELYHFLNERHRALVPRVEAVIRQMKSSGELASLRKKITDRLLSEISK
ncbi:transporter substrate-binding domain-containing protein [Rhodoferax saidenbachensis]|uniref:ABC-type amino acid transport substrate-binding protein n=1 Tax=Rhodoferax saidenbachensis TaxID=1484693 RepID=A0ABU1ZJV2_9BURK|nr:transporter substrate-binding domain-containing protein [Rhodoferax saidenbachensis]MDR7305824.1 ABC-type amino acid transport substrate-binding protein [Rhodoferax saidenbachensis]